MGNIWCAINVWKESLMLPGCLASIRKYIPDAKIVAVDGAYRNLIDEVKKEIALCMDRHHFEVAKNLEPFLNPESDDGTLEVLDNFKVDRVVRCTRDSDGKPLPWEHEYVKRSKYFVGSESDYYFVIDADERLVGSPDLGQLKDDAYNIVLKRDDNTVAYKILRIFKHQQGMHYHGAHHALWVGDRLYRKEDCDTIRGCILEHEQNFRVKREPLRNVIKGLYYRQLTSVEEGPFRAQWRL